MKWKKTISDLLVIAIIPVACILGAFIGVWIAGGPQ